MRRDGGPPSPLIRNTSRKYYTKIKRQKKEKKNAGGARALLDLKWWLALNK